MYPIKKICIPKKMFIVGFLCTQLEILCSTLRMGFALSMSSTSRQGTQMASCEFAFGGSRHMVAMHVFHSRFFYVRNMKLSLYVADGFCSVMSVHRDKVHTWPVLVYPSEDPRRQHGTAEARRIMRCGWVLLPCGAVHRDRVCKWPVVVNASESPPEIVVQ